MKECVLIIRFTVGHGVPIHSRQLPTALSKNIVSSRLKSSNAFFAGKKICVFKARLISSHSAKPSQHPVVSHELFQMTKAAKQLKVGRPKNKPGTWIPSSLMMLSFRLHSCLPARCISPSAFPRAMPLLKGRIPPSPCLLGVIFSGCRPPPFRAHPLHSVGRSKYDETGRR